MDQQKTEFDEERERLHAKMSVNNFLTSSLDYFNLLVSAVMPKPVM